MTTVTLQLTRDQRALLQSVLTDHFCHAVGVARVADRSGRAPLLSRAHEIENLLRLVSSANPTPSDDQAAAGTETPNHVS